MSRGYQKKETARDAKVSRYREQRQAQQLAVMRSIAIRRRALNRKSKNDKPPGSERPDRVYTAEQVLAQFGIVPVTAQTDEDQIEAQSPVEAFQTATSGAPRPVPYQQEMEAAFATDFSHVQAFVGDEAAQTGLASIEAQGAALGSQVAFVDENPSKELVAHELTHVVQAGGGVQPFSDVSQPTDAVEVEAQAVASRVAAGKPAGPISAVDDRVLRDPPTAATEEKGQTAADQVLSTSIDVVGSMAEFQLEHGDAVLFIDRWTSRVVSVLSHIHRAWLTAIALLATHLAAGSSDSEDAPHEFLARFFQHVTHSLFTLLSSVGGLPVRVGLAGLRRLSDAWISDTLEGISDNLGEVAGSLENSTTMVEFIAQLRRLEIDTAAAELLALDSDEIISAYNTSSGEEAGLTITGEKALFLGQLADVRSVLEEQLERPAADYEAELATMWITDPTLGARPYLDLVMAEEGTIEVRITVDVDDEDIRINSDLPARLVTNGYTDVMCDWLNGIFDSGRGPSNIVDLDIPIWVFIENSDEERIGSFRFQSGRRVGPVRFSSIYARDETTRDAISELSSNVGFVSTLLSKDTLVSEFD